MMRDVPLLALVLWALALAGSPRVAHSAPVAGPELNPYACQGQAESLQADRSIGQIRSELEKRLDPELLPTDPPTVRALKLCTIGELKKRVGDSDAIDYYARAIAQNPDEPGYEFFAGRYYAGARGVKGPVLELAETHFYRALDKLERLKESGRYRAFHAVIEDHTQKGLLLLYQQDGLPLLPWKAHPQRKSGLHAPGVAIGTQLSISKDTRFAPGQNEVGGFTAETGLYTQRTGEAPSARKKFDTARNPLRWSALNTLRIRQHSLGAIDLSYSRVKGIEAMYNNYTQLAPPFHDVDATLYGIGYQRVVPLYPLFDLLLRGAYQRVDRVGVVEYLNDYRQKFPVFELKPGVSRFIGSDKLTLSGTYVFMDIPRLDGAAQGPLPDESPLLLRGRAISALTVEYAFYSPLLLPSLHLASLRPYRTPTRGLYLSAGYVNDNELFGDHRSLNDTYFVGVRLEGPGAYDIALNEAVYRGTGTIVTDQGEVNDDDLGSTSLRSSLTIVRRLVNPDATPGVPEAFGPFAPDSLNLALPLSYDKVLEGADYFENFRLGAQLWWKVFGTGLWGTTLLTTVGYDYQYFYRFDKHVHNLNATLRVGWGDL